MLGEIDLEAECRRTRPDYVAYVPQSTDGSTGDTGNEHFMVFEGPLGALQAIWTQSTCEGRPDQHIVHARSDDGGRIWSSPRTIAGANPDPDTARGMASWAFPLVSRSGRIYVIYNLHTGVNDIFSHTTGLMACIFSDDGGRSWSGEAVIPMPRSRWDNPDGGVPANWIVWQRPRRLSAGRYLAGFTRWVSPGVREPAPIKAWWAEESVVEFMRFENLDEDPGPAEIELSWHASDADALRVGMPGHPGVSVVQEPSIVRLPDGRLFCVMRTATGSPWYSLSSDSGSSWSNPEILRYWDEGPALRHPVSPCPIYEVGRAGYLIFYHNHDGNFGPWGPSDTRRHRRPVYVARAEFREGARQPLWFSGPSFLMDNDGVPLGYGEGRCDLAMYSSMTCGDDEGTIWYPDRKFFLLGKRLPFPWLTEMGVKGQQ